MLECHCRYTGAAGLEGVVGDESCDGDGEGAGKGDAGAAEGGGAEKSIQGQSEPAANGGGAVYSC